MRNLAIKMFLKSVAWILFMFGVMMASILLISNTYPSPILGQAAHSYHAELMIYVVAVEALVSSVGCFAICLLHVRKFILTSKNAPQA